MLRVNPYIAYKGNCQDAIEFYKTALNAEMLFVQKVGDSPMPEMGPAEKIMHCSIKIGDSVVMLCDDMRLTPPDGHGNISLAIGLNDPARAKQIFDKLAEDGSVVMPIGKTYWAEAFGVLTDKFGVTWMVNCEAPIM